MAEAGFLLSISNSNKKRGESFDSPLYYVSVSDLDYSLSGIGAPSGNVGEVFW
jgi:hypothetical protein